MFLFDFLESKIIFVSTKFAFQSQLELGFSLLYMLEYSLVSNMVG